MSYIDRIIKSAGQERATLVVVDEVDVNRYGDADEEVTERKVSGVFENVSASREEVEEGDFAQRDINAYIPADFEDIEEGNLLVYQGDEYEIQDVQRYNIGSQGHYEVGASRK